MCLRSLLPQWASRKTDEQCKYTAQRGWGGRRGEKFLFLKNSSMKLLGFPTPSRGLAVPGCGVRRGTHSSLCAQMEAENLIPEQAAFQPRCACYCVPELSHQLLWHICSSTVRFTLSKNSFLFGGWQCWEMNQWPHTAWDLAPRVPHLVRGSLQKLSS